MNDLDPGSCPECGRSDFRLNKLGNSTIGAHRWAKHGVKASPDKTKILRREAAIARQLVIAQTHTSLIGVLPNTKGQHPDPALERLSLEDVALLPPTLGRYCAWPPCPRRLTERNILNGSIYCSIGCRKTANRLRVRNRELEQQAADARALVKEAQNDKADAIRAAQKTIKSQARAERQRNVNLAARVKRLKESLVEARRDAAAATKTSLAAIAELRILRASLGESYLRAMSRPNPE